MIKVAQNGADLCKTANSGSEKHLPTFQPTMHDE